MSSTKDAPEERGPRDDEAARRYYMERDGRMMSVDTAEAYRPTHHSEARHGARPPVSPYGRHVHPTSYPRYQDMQSRTVPHQLHPAVTSSFSAEERETAHSGGRSRAAYIPEQRFDREERYNGEDERDDWHTPRHSGQGMMASSANRMPQPQIVQRTYSSPGYFPHQEPMKRNYYHHSQSGDKFSGELPSDFLPPKRHKLNPSSQGETVVTPRAPGAESAGRRDWYARSGVSDEGRFQYLARSSSYPIPPPWTGHYQQPPSPMAFGRPGKYTAVSPATRSELEGSPRQWPPPAQHWNGQSTSSAWTSPRAGTSEHQWNSPHHESSRKEYDHYSGRVSFEDDRRSGYTPEKMDQAQTPSSNENKMDLVVEATAVAATKKVLGTKELNAARYDEQENSRTMMLPTGESVLLLALPQDRVALSETLCVVREVRFVYVYNLLAF
jgi:hypothetical protein